MPFAQFLSLTFLGLFCISSANALDCNSGKFVSMGKCELCPPGTYKPKKDNSTRCFHCPAGFFNPFRGSKFVDVCQPCPAGTFSSKKGATASTVCKPCPKGKASLPGSPRCLACPRGQIMSRCPLDANSDVDQRITIPGKCLLCFFEMNCEPFDVKFRCRKCGANYFSPVRNGVKCLRCPDSRGSLPGSGGCNLCPAGQGVFLNPTVKKSLCRPCEENRFNDGTTGPCRVCPAGFIAKARGATKCEPCPKGTADREFGFPVKCNACKPGENSFARGASICVPDNTPCASNFFRNFMGVCQRCTKRQRYNPKKKTCEECGANEQSEGGLATKCTKCPAGSAGFIDQRPFGVDFGDLGCICKEGFIWVPSGQCKKCPPGTFKAFPEDSDCTKCYPGTFQPQAGMTECVTCPAGTVQPIRGQTKCVKCPKGLIPGIFASFCADPKTNCAPGENRFIAFTDLPSCRSPEKRPRRPCDRDEFLASGFDGQYIISPEFGTKFDACSKCAAGEISDGGTVSKCKPCPENEIRFMDKCQCVSFREKVNGKCRLCGPGMIGAVGVAGCKPCPAGFLKSGSGRGSCRPCAAGKFSGAGASKCLKCPAGTVTYGIGEANCVKPGSLAIEK